jgi:hypothetical protein
LAANQDAKRASDASVEAAKESVAQAQAAADAVQSAFAVQQAQLTQAESEYQAALRPDNNLRWHRPLAMQTERGWTADGRISRAQLLQLQPVEPHSPARCGPVRLTKGIRLLGMTLSSLGEKQLESEPQLSLSF